MLHLRLFFRTFSYRICVRERFTCIFVSFTIIFQFYLTDWYFDRVNSLIILLLFLVIYSIFIWCCQFLELFCSPLVSKPFKLFYFVFTFLGLQSYMVFTICIQNHLAMPIITVSLNSYIPLSLRMSLLYYVEGVIFVSVLSYL